MAEGPLLILTPRSILPACKGVAATFAREALAPPNPLLPTFALSTRLLHEQLHALKLRNGQTIPHIALVVGLIMASAAVVAAKGSRKKGQA